MIVIDWGTTNLRAYHCQDDGTIINRLDDFRGIKSLRKQDYSVILTGIIEHFNAQKESIYISGMAGSRNGWVEVPYQQVPLTGHQLAKSLQPLPPPSPGYLVPGVRTIANDGSTDVIRGEEVQVIGAVTRLALEDALLCLPGTHSKWLQVEQRNITSFVTFMTGDVFQALGQTILACKTDDGFHQDVFLQGVDAVTEIDGGLLHQLFMARTRMLDSTLEEIAVSSFISGLLLGHELQQAQLLYKSIAKVIVIGSDQLSERYRCALQHQSIKVDVLGSDLATCAGMATLCQCLKREE